LKSDKLLPTPQPTVEVTNSPTLTKEQLIYDIIRPIYSTLSATVVFEDKLSPQFRAWKWLANEDEYEGFNKLADLSSDTIEQERVIERYVLAVLYFGTHGESWKFPTIFMNSTDICLWDSESLGVNEGSLLILGVSLCDSQSFVRDLRLTSFNMTGTIPFELSRLARLETLIIEKNNLVGSIPPEIFSLSHLSTFYIGENALEGSIPNAIGNLTSLENLVRSLFFFFYSYKEHSCHYPYLFAQPLNILHTPFFFRFLLSYSVSCKK